MRKFKFLKYFLSLHRTKLNRSYEINKISEECEKLKINLTNFYKSLVYYNIYTQKEMGEFILKELK